MAQSSFSLKGNRPRARKFAEVDDSAEIVEFLLANMAQGFLVRDELGAILMSSTKLNGLAGMELSGMSARDLLPGLKDSDGQYEIEFTPSSGQSRIISVVTARKSVGPSGAGFMDLLTEIKTDHVLRDRLVAEVQKMSKLAQTDSLTGLANRAEFDGELHRLSHDGQGAPFGVAIVDLDDFKDINDRYGHSAGDSALIEFGSRLRHSVRDSDLVARLGGDEFAVLLVGARKDVAARLVERLIENLSFSLPVGSELVPVRASVGWAHSDDGEDLIFESADRRMYLEKRRRKSR